MILYCMWAVIIIVNSYNLFAGWQPFTFSAKKKARVREEAMRQVEASDRGIIKDMDRNAVESIKSYETLLLCSRYGKDYSLLELRSMSNRLRVSRSRLRSAFYPTRLSAEQVATYMRFDDQMKDLWIDIDDSKKMNRKRNEVTGTVIYAIRNLDRADEILEIVKSRGISDVKHIKAVLNRAEEAPANAVGDGWL